MIESKRRNLADSGSKTGGISKFVTLPRMLGTISAMSAAPAPISAIRRSLPVSWTYDRIAWTHGQ